jgi:hypothetical protein
MKRREFDARLTPSNGRELSLETAASVARRLCQTRRMSSLLSIFVPARRANLWRALGWWVVLGVVGVLAASLAVAQPATSPDELTLYGLRLKDASAEDFIAAASAAGAQVQTRRADGTVVFDVRAAGVPALQQLTLSTEKSVFVSARFVLKPYGQDNEALRQLLVKKYGVPFAADGARRPFPNFAGRFAPRGSYDWDFAGGMKLIYRQPALGDSTLSYTDVARVQSLPPAAAPLPERAGSALENRF